MKSKKFNRTKRWVATSGWRGYETFNYAVCGANDTGMWEDSPCRSDVATKELNMVKSKLRSGKIPFKEVAARSSNVFCVHRYIIVPPDYMSEAKEVVQDILKTNGSELNSLYSEN